MASTRVFQKRRTSGSPSLSLGPGNSSRKKSTSCSSNERSPLGTTLTAWWSRSGRSDVGRVKVLSTDGVARKSVGGWTVGDGFGTSGDRRKHRRSSARSSAVVYRSVALLDSAFRQALSNSLGIV